MQDKKEDCSYLKYVCEQILSVFVFRNPYSKKPSYKLPYSKVCI